MKSVNITELKNRLSVYLNDVKAGEEILVRDRNQPVARIVPLVRSRDEDEELLALAAQGNCAWARVFVKSSSGRSRRRAFLPPLCAAQSNRSEMKTKRRRNSGRR